MEILDWGILASLTYHNLSVNPTWALGPSSLPSLLVGKVVCQRAQYVSSAHSFQTPTHPTCLPLDFPDVHSLQPQLDCGDTEIKVSLDKCLLGSLGFGDEVHAYLRDGNWNCSSLRQSEEENWISVTNPTQAGACGNILEVRDVYTPAARVQELGRQGLCQ